jgi:hypothetical protein
MVPDYLNLVIIFITISIPLICSGVCMSLIFDRYAKQASRIYFINLIGASLGCLIFIPLINFLEVVNSYFLLAFMGLAAAHLFNRGNRLRIGKSIIILSIIFTIIPLVNHQKAFLELKWVKGQPNDTYFYKKWNSFSYVRLHSDGIAFEPKGWSWAPNKSDELASIAIKQIQLDIDGGAGTVMTDFEDRNLEKLDFLKYDITSLPYNLVENGDVLVIGVGLRPRHPDRPPF